MIIHKIYIGHFGKFCRFTYEFEEGFQVIYGENEFGKTTIMAFIQLMFYGNASAKRVFYENPRKKYEPWSKEPMSGWLEFSWREEQYRLEKQFGKSAHTDTTKLYRLEDGKEIDLQGKEAGEYFFGLDRTAFERMFFIQNNNVFMDKKASEYAFYQLWTEGAGIDTESFTAAVKILEQGKEEIVSKSGKKGTLVELQEQKKRLSSHQIEAEKQLEKREQIAQERATLSARIQELEQQLYEYEQASYSKNRSNFLFVKLLLSIMMSVCVCFGILYKYMELYVLAAFFVLVLCFVCRLQKIKEGHYEAEESERTIQLKESQKQVESIAELLDAQKKLLKDLSTLENSLSGKNGFETPEQIAMNKKKLAEQELQLQQKYNAYQVALAILHETKDEMQKACSPALNQCTGKYLERLSGGKYTAVFIKEGFEIVLFDSVSQQYHGWQYFSQSTKEILYLSLRLALVELLMKQDRVPLFLDDVLLSLDKERKQNALELFKEYGKQHQVILFSCQ